MRPDQIEAVKRSYEVSVGQAAKEAGVSQRAIFRWRRKYKATRQAEPTPAEEKLEVAALKSRVAELESGGISTPETLWNQTAARNRELIRRHKQRANVEVSLPGAEPVGIVMVSDQHISEGLVDLERMRADAELIRDTDGLFCLLGGDGIDNAIKHRASIVMSNMSPDRQLELFNYYLQIIKGKTLALISGNHDAWSVAMAGIDPIGWLADQNRITYSPAEAKVTITVGTQTYRVVIRHQYRFNSSFNLGHTVKRLYDMGDEPFDIGCVCHHHEPSIESFRKHGLERWACRPGSYQISSGYSLQFGFNDTTPTCPTFILDPHRREIVGFNCVRRAAKYLGALRNG